MQLCSWFLFDLQPRADCCISGSGFAAPLPHRAVARHQKYSGRRQEKNVEKISSSVFGSPSVERPFPLQGVQWCFLVPEQVFCSVFPLKRLAFALIFNSMRGGRECREPGLVWC